MPINLAFDLSSSKNVLCTNTTSFSEREAEILKPLASVEVTEKEDATFETEISEDDVPGEWKLKGEVLTRSPVRLDGPKL